MIPRSLDSLPRRSRWCFVVLLALATAAGALSCRKHLPRPPDGPIPPGPGQGGSGGRGGSGGSGGGMTGGAGGAGDARDMAAPDVELPDTMEAGADMPVACGGANQPCCPGNECKNNGCCERGMCTAQFESCKLGDSAACVGGSCGGMCGAPAVLPTQPAHCCNERNCTKPLSVCTGVGRGTCVSCGSMGEVCCADGYCKPGTNCVNMMCTAPAALTLPD